MSSLQKVNLGTAPTGTDGDPVRTGFVKTNDNVDVLSTQAALTSNPTTITTAQALTVAHVGRRVNINLGTAGTVNLPSASTCAVDNVVLLRNVGTTVVTLAITAGSGDSVALSKLNPGEAALMDTDGAHAWRVLMRGRSNSDNEVVNGNCTVAGNETVAGALTVIGSSSFGSTGQASISAAGAYSGTGGAYSGLVTAASGFRVPNNVGYQATSTLGNAVSVLYIDGSNNVGVGNNTIPLQLIGSSVKINGNTPWDSGNLSNPAHAGANSDITSISGISTLNYGSSLAIQVGGSEKLRFDVSGNFLQGVSSYLSGYATGVSTANMKSMNAGSALVIQSSTDSNIYLSKGNGFSSGALMTFYAVGNACGSISTNGTSVAYNTSSDRRLKENFAPITDALSVLAAAKPYTFSFIGDPKGRVVAGFIADEYMEIQPDAVNGEANGVDQNGNPIYQALDYSRPTPYLVAAVQELKAILDNQATEIADLRATLASGQ